jgi:hypothetical protein
LPESIAEEGEVKVGRRRGTRRRRYQRRLRRRGTNPSRGRRKVGEDFSNGPPSSKGQAQYRSFPQKRRGIPKGKKLPKFEDVLKAYLAGDTKEQMAEEFGLIVTTIENKLPALELAKLKLGLGKKTPSTLVPANETVSSASSGMVAGPVQAVAPPSTGMVPAGTPGAIVYAVQGKASEAISKEGEEDGEGPETPDWMKGDGREVVNTIEMAIRG